MNAHAHKINTNIFRCKDGKTTEIRIEMEGIQWNLTNPDTNGTMEIVLINGVSSFQGVDILCFYIAHEDQIMH